MNTWIAGSRPLKKATPSLQWPRNRTLKGQYNEAALKQMGRRRPSPCLAYFHRSTPNLQLEHWPWRMLVAQWTLTLYVGLIYLCRSPWELGQTGPVVGEWVGITIRATVTIRPDLRTRASRGQSLVSNSCILYVNSQNWLSNNTQLGYKHGTISLMLFLHYFKTT